MQSQAAPQWFSHDGDCPRWQSPEEGRITLTAATSATRSMRPRALSSLWLSLDAKNPDGERDFGRTGGSSRHDLPAQGSPHPAHLDRSIHEFWLHTKRGHRSIYLGGYGVMTNISSEEVGHPPTTLRIRSPSSPRNLQRWSLVELAEVIDDTDSSHVFEVAYTTFQ